MALIASAAAFFTHRMQMHSIGWVSWAMLGLAGIGLAELWYAIARIRQMKPEDTGELAATDAPKQQPMPSKAPESVTTEQEPVETVVSPPTPEPESGADAIKVELEDDSPTQPLLD